VEVHPWQAQETADVHASAGANGGMLGGTDQPHRARACNGKPGGDG